MTFSIPSVAPIHPPAHPGSTVAWKVRGKGARGETSGSKASTGTILALDIQAPC